MMVKSQRERNSAAEIVVEVAESGDGVSENQRIPCVIGRELAFSTTALESYLLANWEPVLFDALLVAAAVEFCDRTFRRREHHWARELLVRIPVHDVQRWSSQEVYASLTDALNFLTGDRWHFSFHPRRKPQSLARQRHLSIEQDVEAVMPFSNGMDSLAVAGLMERELGSSLMRIRLGTTAPGERDTSSPKRPFAAVPFRIRPAQGYRLSESSARSRGFKFALLSGLSAYLCGAHRVILPESGQGALGPWLIPVGQTYADFRNHPLFTRLMEKFLSALLSWRGRYEIPRLWSTKGETLRKFALECPDGYAAVMTTSSCWQQSRQVSVEKKKRQCGVCAACMLRRMSMHAAGIAESSERYVWVNLGAEEFSIGADPRFAKEKITRAMHEYAIAGVLHMDHLASILHSPTGRSAVALKAFQVSRACALSEQEAGKRMDRLLRQHEAEWQSFLASLGEKSFVVQWTAGRV